MKKLKLIFSLLLLNACADQPSHTISGRLEFGGNTTLVLSEITGDGEVPLDSTTTDSHGSFSLRNAATQRDYYLLRTGPQSVIYLILDGSEDVVLTGDARQLDATYTVKGSDESELIRLLRARDRQLTDSLNRTFAGLSFLNPVERDSAAHGLETVYTGVMRSYAADMIRDHPGSLASLSATKFLHQSADAALMRLLADSLSVRYPGNLYVEDYLKLVRDLERLPPGTTAPAIRGKTPEGKEISLSDFKGKLLLVDFWASWCGPCRRANPDLKRLYSQYRSDRFEILGVSLDDDRDSWKQAIRNDGLTWPQLSELRKWDGQCVKDYGIEAIPFSVLVDEDGKILAKGLTAEDLHRVIREHLYKKDKGAQDGRP